MRLAHIRRECVRLQTAHKKHCDDGLQRRTYTENIRFTTNLNVTRINFFFPTAGQRHAERRRYVIYDTRDVYYVVYSEDALVVHDGR